MAFHPWPWMVQAWPPMDPICRWSLQIPSMAMDGTWMVHHWPSMEFRKIFRTKIRSKCESSKCTLVNAKFELASHCVIAN